MPPSSSSALSTQLPLVIADENIPQIGEALSGIARVELRAGRGITPSDVAEAKALFVRSITKVNRSLLAKSAVRFVGSATIGMDHIATAELDELGIAYTNAAGSNANSVVEYVICALIELHAQRVITLGQGFILGIVGKGNIGTPLFRLAERLGFTVLCCDPPKAEAGQPGPWYSLAEVFDRSDVVTLHTPLTTSGPHPTHQLIGPAELEALGPKGVLINAARGSVVQNQPLLEALKQGSIGGAILDCWENEPEYLAGLHEQVFFGTPHIAGYSHDGKLAGTRQIVEAFTRFKNLKHSWQPILTPPAEPVITLAASGKASAASPWDALLPIVRASYDLRQDDAALRPLSVALAGSNPKELRTKFDALRKNYPLRREFSAYTVAGTNIDPHLANILNVLGFTLS